MGTYIHSLLIIDYKQAVNDSKKPHPTLDRIHLSYQLPFLVGRRHCQDKLHSNPLFFCMLLFFFSVKALYFSLSISLSIPNSLFIPHTNKICKNAVLIILLVMFKDIWGVSCGHYLSQSRSTQHLFLQRICLSRTEWVQMTNTLFHCDTSVVSYSSRFAFAKAIFGRPSTTKDKLAHVLNFICPCSITASLIVLTCCIKKKQKKKLTFDHSLHRSLAA